MNQRDLPPGMVNWASGLVTRNVGIGRKVYVSHQEDGCNGCPDRHFIMHWEDDTTYKVNNVVVRESEFTERLEEGVDGIIQRRKKEGF